VADITLTSSTRDSSPEVTPHEIFDLEKRRISVQATAQTTHPPNFENNKPCFICRRDCAARASATAIIRAAVSNRHPLRSNAELGAPLKSRGTLVFLSDFHRPLHCSIGKPTQQRAGDEMQMVVESSTLRWPQFPRRVPA